MQFKPTWRNDIITTGIQLCLIWSPPVLAMDQRPKTMVFALYKELFTVEACGAGPNVN